ncbi:MAG: 2-amino-4-hydroxy-6-hydroxymethyldihydropteridine diphosphokinase [Hyphomicrobium sp.]
MTPGLEFDAILALGSNVGDKRANIAEAIGLLQSDFGVAIERRSRDFKTPPWGVTDQDWFANACVGVATGLSPARLLKACQGVEATMGRVRAGRWGPRNIDVDILVHHAGPVSSAALTLPHPRITERAFVLAPLADIAPGLVIQGKSVADWLERVDRQGIEPFATDAP